MVVFGRITAACWRFRSDVKIGIARASGAKIDRGCFLSGGANACLGIADPRRGQIDIGPQCWLDRGALLHPWGGSIRLGEHVYIGPYAVIYGHGGVEIGDQSLVAMHCKILSSNHTVPPRRINIRSQPDEKRPTKIGRDVWIGAGVTILGGVVIGDGTIIGAGAVVTKNLPSHSIALGVPAEVVGERV